MYTTCSRSSIPGSRRPLPARHPPKSRNLLNAHWVRTDRTRALGSDRCRAAGGESRARTLLVRLALLAGCRGGRARHSPQPRSTSSGRHISRAELTLISRRRWAAMPPRRRPSGSPVSVQSRRRNRRAQHRCQPRSTPSRPSRRASWHAISLTVRARAMSSQRERGCVLPAGTGPEEEAGGDEAVPPAPASVAGSRRRELRH